MEQKTLTKIQAGSGAVFSIFVILHLANTMAAATGAGAYDAFQERFRSFYQNPALELTGLAVPLAVHVVAALSRYRLFDFRFRQKSVRGKLHAITGLYLLTAIFGHVLATRGPSLFYDFHPGNAGLSFSLWWKPLLFYPYYVVFSCSALYHTANGLLLAAAAWGWRVPGFFRRGPGFYVPVGLGVLGLILGVLALGGLLYEIPDPTDNDYARMWESYGVELGREK